MKKAIIGVIIAIVLVAIVGIGVLVVNDFKQEDILRQEMLEFENLTRVENIDLDQIDQRIRELKTTGDYGVLEKAMKDYLADVLNATVSIADVLNDERIINQTMVFEKTDKLNVPLCHKPLLTIEEASKYFGIGKNKLYEITDRNDCDFVVFNNSKRLIKREKMEQWLNEQIYI